VVLLLLQENEAPQEGRRASHCYYLKETVALMTTTMGIRDLRWLLQPPPELKAD
jgi:hypothetical protein